MERRAARASADALQHDGFFKVDPQPGLLGAIRAGVIVSGTHPHDPEWIVQNLAIWTPEKHDASTDDKKLKHRRRKNKRNCFFRDKNSGNNFSFFPFRLARRNLWTEKNRPGFPGRFFEFSR
jgi:hypothetical protein